MDRAELQDAVDCKDNQIDCCNWQAGDVARAVGRDSAASAAVFGGSAGNWHGPGSCSCGGGVVDTGWWLATCGPAPCVRTYAGLIQAMLCDFIILHCSDDYVYVCCFACCCALRLVYCMDAES